MSYIIGSTKLFTVDATLENDMLSPNANANSLPLNHLATIEHYATFNDSPPNPNIALPIHIHVKSSLYPPIVKTNYPKVKIVKNTNNPILTPTLSMKIPPNKGRIILGMEYTV